MFNLLTEPLIQVDLTGGNRQSLSLPEVYAVLMADTVDAFPALRPHQRHAWHAFLVQLGAIALHRAGQDTPPAAASEWQRIIRALTPDYPEDEPWQLVVDDITRPAFMQPPSTNWKGYNQKDLFLTPDSLDMLDTAKNHDLKTYVGVEAAADDWLFALISMQTMNGQVGRGNYPIARMNSGDGSRTAFSVTPSVRVGAHIRRDTEILVEQVQEILEELPFKGDGISLLWIKKWDGKKAEALLLSDLHPFFIEICRRRRLCLVETERLYGMKAPSEFRRIAAAESRGVVGDPWMLVDLRDKKGNKALTLQRDSFSYKKVTEYLTSGDWQLPLLCRPTDKDSKTEVQLVMRGIRRKQGGQTEGYYERTIPVQQRLRNAMLRRSQSETEDLGNIAQSRIDEVATVQRILSHAIRTFVARGDRDNTGGVSGEKTRPWLNRLDNIVDTNFFYDLQTELGAVAGDRQRIRNNWLMNGNDGVVDHARSLLQEATNLLPCPAIYRYKAKVSAEGLFEVRIRGSAGLPFLFYHANEEDNEC